MGVGEILVIAALVFAIISFVDERVNWLAVAVILLCIRLLLGVL